MSLDRSRERDFHSAVSQYFRAEFAPGDRSELLRNPIKLPLRFDQQTKCVGELVTHDLR
jgi:hypothetical protein